MLESAIQLWLLLALASSVGLPFAILLDRGRSSFWLILAEGVAIGVLWAGLSGVILARWLESNPISLAMLALVPAGVAWLAVWRTSRPPQLTSPGLMGLVVLAILAAATLLRSPPVHFIFRVGDFGEYIARAETLASDGAYPQGFLPHLTTLLATSQHLLGPDDLTVLASALGVLLVIMVGATLHRLALPRPATCLAMAFVAVAASPTWFGSFPATETLYSALLVSLVYFFAKASEGASSLGSASLVGLFAVGLGLTRGNALLLAGVFLIAAVLLAVRLPPRSFRGAAAACAAGAVGIWLTTLFAVQYHNRYFVQNQLEGHAPDSLFPLFERLEQVNGALIGTVVISVVTLGVLLGLTAVNRRLSAGLHAAEVSPARRWAWAGLLFLAPAGAIVLIRDLGGEGLRSGVAGFGFVALVLAAVGLAALILRPSTDSVAAAGTFVVLALVPYAVFFATQYPEPVEHSFYRYYERYLFSDVYPMTALLTGLGAAAVLILGRRITTFPDLPVAGGVAVLVAGGGLLLALDDGALGRQQVLFENDYAQLAAVSSAIPRDGKPVLYDGGGGFPGFVNSFRAIGLPLITSFDADIVNLPPRGFDADPRVSREELVQTAQREQAVYLMSVGRPGESLPEPPATPEGTFSTPVAHDVVVRLLRQRNGPTRWEEARLRVEVRRFTLVPGYQPVRFNSGFDKPEAEAGTVARWTLAKRARMSFTSASTGKATVSFRLGAFHRPRNVIIRLDGVEVDRAEIRPGPSTRISFPAFLERGRHSITLTADPGPQSIMDTIKVPDDRRVALRFLEPLVVR